MPCARVVLVFLRGRIGLQTQKRLPSILFGFRRMEWINSVTEMWQSKEHFQRSSQDTLWPLEYPTLQGQWELSIEIKLSIWRWEINLIYLHEARVKTGVLVKKGSREARVGSEMMKARCWREVVSPGASSPAGLKGEDSLCQEEPTLTPHQLGPLTVVLNLWVHVSKMTKVYCLSCPVFDYLSQLSCETINNTPILLIQSYIFLLCPV